MDRDLLDNVKFKKNVKLKGSKNRDSHDSQIFIAVMQLVFFIMTLVILWFGGKYTIISIASFCRGEKFHTWQEMVDDYRESR